MILRECILLGKVCIMKTRITLTIDPEVVGRAKRIAHARHTSVSALIEGFLRSASATGSASGRPFSQEWGGRFHAAPSTAPDPRLDALKAKYHLESE